MVAADKYNVVISFVLKKKKAKFRDQGIWLLKNMLV